MTTAADEEDTFEGAHPVETNERMVYEVLSESRPGRTYRVDLLANGGAGQCSCKDWATRRWPAIKAGKQAGTRATLCRHGIKARRYFLNGLLARMAKEEGS